MTLPVANPPEYEPGAPPPPPTPEEAREIAALAHAQAVAEAAMGRGPAVTSGPPSLLRGPGCVVAGGLLAGLVVLFVALVGYLACSGVFDQYREMLADKICIEVREQSRAGGTLDASTEATLDRVARLAHAHEIEFTAFAILVNRWTEAHADREVTPEELRRLVDLLRDIDAGHGHVDMERYPEGR